MKTDINGHGRSQTVIDGEKRWAKNGNGDSRSALNGNVMVTGWLRQRDKINRSTVEKLMNILKFVVKMFQKFLKIFNGFNAERRKKFHY